MTLKLMIFDLDGTVLDTLYDLGDAVKNALISNGFPERSYDEVRRFVGNGVAKLMERALPDGEKSEENIKKVLDDFSAYYEKHYSDKTLPYPGMQKLLKDLKSRGIKLALYSNKPDVFTKELADKFYPGIFDFILGSTPEIPRKPDPKGEKMIMSHFGCGTDEAIHVGDSDTDVMTAHNAGIKCIGCVWGYRPKNVLEYAGADHIADCPDDILNIVLNM